MTRSDFSGGLASLIVFAYATMNMEKKKKSGKNRREHQKGPKRNLSAASTPIRSCVYCRRYRRLNTADRSDGGGGGVVMRPRNDTHRLEQLYLIQQHHRRRRRCTSHDFVRRCGRRTA